MLVVIHIFTIPVVFCCTKSYWYISGYSKFAPCTIIRAYLLNYDDLVVNYMKVSLDYGSISGIASNLRMIYATTIMSVYKLLGMCLYRV